MKIWISNLGSNCPDRNRMFHQYWFWSQQSSLLKLEPKKTVCSRKLGYFYNSQGTDRLLRPRRGGGVGVDWVLRIVWCIKTLPTHPPPLKFMTITYENCIRSISLHLISKRIKEIVTQKYILFVGHISYFDPLHILCIPKLTPQNQAS